MHRLVGEVERVHYQSPRFQERMFRALAIISQALKKSRRPYIAFSGGKDSLATTALVHMVAPDVPLVWSDDELEYPETVDLMTRLDAVAEGQLTILLCPPLVTHANWFRPWTDAPAWREPLPGSLAIDIDVDEWQASQGHDLTFLGLRMEENRRRRDWLLEAGPTYGAKTGTLRRCCPIYDWTADEVWALIAGRGLLYNAAYDRLESIGVHRKAQRVGPLPLTRRTHLAEGWPDLLEQLEARYGKRWG